MQNVRDGLSFYSNFFDQIRTKISIPTAKISNGQIYLQLYALQSNPETQRQVACMPARDAATQARVQRRSDAATQPNLNAATATTLLSVRTVPLAHCTPSHPVQSLTPSHVTPGLPLPRECLTKGQNHGHFTRGFYCINLPLCDSC